jgi:UDP-N-acetylglucosamine 2-epimerase
MGTSDLKVLTIVGARPQFIKAAAVSRAFARHNGGTTTGRRIEEIIVHTGQHYDKNMSGVFFEDLAIPEPKHNLEVGSGPHGWQTGAMLERLEKVLLLEAPALVLVYGDTNSTLAGALAAAKLHIPVAHVEAGLRSFNRRMPEEINRIVADQVSALLLCPTKVAVENLRREGIVAGVHNVGDVMLDSVLFNASLAGQRSTILETLNLAPKSYFLATVHRAENTDDPKRLAGIFQGLAAADVQVVVPLHPRTQNVMRSSMLKAPTNVRVLPPLSYWDILVLERSARAILTDSGGMQKEAYFFKVPCVTLREETEWTELVEAGANFLAGCEPGRIREGLEWSRQWRPSPQSEPLYGAGNASGAIVELLRTWQG